MPARFSPALLLALCACQTALPGDIYFDAHGQAADAPVKGGYYRKILKAHARQQYTVQDFYSDGRAYGTSKRLTHQQLETFRPQP
ncbi:hypothetical protein [Conchiformibius kuhniae]|uniref:Lipoprotein n=1 Tax=Conchiformibius kuhniae TaxID=211502 RepID=A0A8T9MUA6_9NEIS|nr:hypothetical protein [Conchiformibius kuhniae]UOP05207.1 hypothetical protein LVJ77_02940 [Conchiformibius kuhniae]